MQGHGDPEPPLQGDELDYDYQLDIRFDGGVIAILPVADALEIAILVDDAAAGIVDVETDFAGHRQLHSPSSDVIEEDMLFVAD